MNVKRTARKIANDCIGYRVRMLNRVASRVYDEALRPHGIRFSQMNILTAVILIGPTRPAEISRQLQLEKSTLSRNLGIMEDNGWLITEPAETGAGRLVRVTNAGQECYQAAAPAWRQAQATIAAMLGRGGAVAIAEATDRIRAAEAL